MLFALFLFLAQDPVVWERSNEDLSHYISSFKQAVVTEKEELYVLDRREQRVFHLNAQGVEQKVFGRKGEGPGEMNRANFIQYHPGLKTLFLYSWAKPELYAFSLDGAPLAKSVPSKHGPIVLGDDLRVYIEGPETKTEENQGAIIFIENDKTKEKRDIFKNDAKRHQDPARVKTELAAAAAGFPWYAKSLLAASLDSRWLVMGSNTALDFHIYDLKQMKMSGRFEDNAVKHPVLSEEEIAANGTRINLAGKVYVAKDFWHPDYKPPVNRVFFDTSGRIWVALTLPWKAEQRHYRVFTRDGKPLGKLQLPASETVLHVSENHLWLDRYDKTEDIHYLQKRRYQLGQ